MYHDFESHTITRRSFLKGAGAAASGKGLSELFTYETSGREIESWNMLYSQ